MAESKPFIPAFWLKNPHLQTFWPFLFRFNPKPNYQRERIKLPDGDFINLDHVKRSSAKSAKALVLLVHGLQGSSRSHYIRGITQTLSNAGYKAAAKAHLTQPQLKKVLPNWTDTKTFYEFDDAVTARLHGYRNADDYYEKASTKTKLKNIEIPLLLIQSSDDPFMSDDVIPSIAQLHANTKLEAYESGGHVGFVAANGLKPYYWLDQRVLNFIEQQQN